MIWMVRETHLSILERHPCMNEQSLLYPEQIGRLLDFTLVIHRQTCL
jgi:hypothetical protein